MDKLPSFIRQLIHSDRHGGRVLCTDEHTLVLYDCGVWMDVYSTLVRESFPECDITIQTSQSSLSGFIVIFRLHPDRSVFFWIFLTLLLLAVLVLTARVMLKDAV